MQILTDNQTEEYRNASHFWQTQYGRVADENKLMIERVIGLETMLISAGYRKHGDGWIAPITQQQ